MLCINRGYITGLLRGIKKILLLLICSSRVRLLATPWLQPTRLLCLWDFPGKNTGVGCHCLLLKKITNTTFFRNSWTRQLPNIDIIMLLIIIFCSLKNTLGSRNWMDFSFSLFKLWNVYRSNFVFNLCIGALQCCTMKWISYQFSSVAQSYLTLCDPQNCSTLGLPVHHQLPEFTQTHVHRVNDAIQPSHPLSSPSPPAPNPSQHQSLFQWVNSSHEVAKVLEFQL